MSRPVACAQRVVEHRLVARADALGRDACSAPRARGCRARHRSGWTPWNHVCQVASASCAAEALGGLLPDAFGDVVEPGRVGPRRSGCPQARPQLWRTAGTGHEAVPLGWPASGPRTPRRGSRVPVVAGTTGAAERSTGRAGAQARITARGRDAWTRACDVARAQQLPLEPRSPAAPRARRLVRFVSRRPAPASPTQEAMREAHVPAQQPQAEEDPRLPAPHAHARAAGRCSSRAVSGAASDCRPDLARPRPCDVRRPRPGPLGSERAPSRSATSRGR